jgi:amino acid permease
MDPDWDVRIYMAILLPFLIIFSLVRNLKYLAPFSMIANGLIAAGLGITFYYIFSDLPSIETVRKISSWKEMPLFFGIAIFALEGIGVVSNIYIFNYFKLFIRTITKNLQYSFINEIFKFYILLKVCWKSNFCITTKFIVKYIIYLHFLIIFW